MAKLWTTHIILTALVVVCGATSDDPLSMSTKLHGELILPCKPENISNTTVSWSFLPPSDEEKNVTMGLTSLDPTFEILHPTLNERNLKLTFLTEGKVGVYTCKSKTEFGKIIMEAKYNVSISPEMTNNDDRPATMIVNTHIGKIEELKCIVEDKNRDTDMIQNTNSILPIPDGFNIGDKRGYKYAYIVIKPVYPKDADLACVFKEQLKPSDLDRISWRSNENQTITSNSVGRKYDLKTKITETVLTVKKVNPSGSDGTYKALFDNKPLENCMYRIEVQKQPAVDKTLSSSKMVLKEGETANLTCVMTGRPEPNIRWGRRRRIKNPELEKLQVEGPTLIIPNISRYAADVYVCKGSNVIGGKTYDDDWSIDVNVDFGPEIDSFEDEVSITNNRDVMLHCLIKAGKRPKTHWCNVDTGNTITSNFNYHPKDLEELEGYSAYMMTLSLLVEKSAEHVFTANYSCRAEVDGINANETIIVRDKRQRWTGF